MNYKDMFNVFGIQPSIEHYGLYGHDLNSRVGHITKVEELIQNLPITAYRSVPAAFLELAEFIVTLRFAEKAAQQLPKLDHNDPGTYVLLSKIYSSMEKWEESKWIRELMSETKLK